MNQPINYSIRESIESTFAPEIFGRLGSMTIERTLVSVPQSALRTNGVENLVVALRTIFRTGPLVGNGDFFAIGVTEISVSLSIASANLVDVGGTLALGLTGTGGDDDGSVAVGPTGVGVGLAVVSADEGVNSITVFAINALSGVGLGHSDGGGVTKIFISSSIGSTNVGQIWVLSLTRIYIGCWLTGS